MNLNENIEKQKSLVDGLNKDIDKLIKEYSWKDLATDALTVVISGPAGLLRKKSVKSIISKLEDEEASLKDKEDEEEDEDKKRETKKELNDLKKSIEEIKSLLKKQQSGGSSYNEIVFRVNEDVTVRLEKYGTEKYEHTFKKGINLKYKIINVNKKIKYLILQESKMKEYFTIKLDYDNLTIGDKQESYISLIYEKGNKSLDGQRKKIKFNIKSIK